MTRMKLLVLNHHDVTTMLTMKECIGVMEEATYRFTPGVAKTSLARGVAERLGVTRESLRALLLRIGAVEVRVPAR